MCSTSRGPDPRRPKSPRHRLGVRATRQARWLAVLYRDVQPQPLARWWVAPWLNGDAARALLNITFPRLARLRISQQATHRSHPGHLHPLPGQMWPAIEDGFVVVRDALRSEVDAAVARREMKVIQRPQPAWTLTRPATPCWADIDLAPLDDGHACRRLPVLPELSQRAPPCPGICPCSSRCADRLSTLRGHLSVEGLDIAAARRPPGSTRGRPQLLHRRPTRTSPHRNHAGPTADRHPPLRRSTRPDMTITSPISTIPLQVRPDASLLTKPADPHRPWPSAVAIPGMTPGTCIPPWRISTKRSTTSAGAATQAVRRCRHHVFALINVVDDPPRLPFARSTVRGQDDLVRPAVPATLPTLAGRPAPHQPRGRSPMRTCAI